MHLRQVVSKRTAAVARSVSMKERNSRCLQQHQLVERALAAIVNLPIVFHSEPSSPTDSRVRHLGSESGEQLGLWVLRN